ncbi:MAG: VWA domain-containing protein, partial [Acidobacteriaceae bacterium]|nr:VWA domain-containing protein [Acidobacteriaceae bacterium]
MRTCALSRIFDLSVRAGGRFALNQLSKAGFALLCALLATTWPAGAQAEKQGNDTPQAVQTPGEPVAIPSRKPAAAAAVASKPVDIRVERQLVLINVTVTDPLNRFVTGLEKQHFRLFEDKVEQIITHFSSEDAPISIGLVFDTSGSMGSKLQKSRQAAAEFFKTANPSDEFFLVQFNDRPELTVPFTTDTDKVQSTLTFTQSHGRTALLDSVYLAMHEMKKAKNPRKALLIISDGGDNSSRYTETEIKNAVREADVQI